MGSRVDEMSATSFSDLEEDVLLRVLALLRAADLLALGASCRRLHALAERDDLWAPLCARRWTLPVAWAARARSWPPVDGSGGPAFRKLPPPPALGAHRGCELVRLRDSRSHPDSNGRLALRISRDTRTGRALVALVGAALPLSGAAPTGVEAACAIDEMRLVDANSLEPVFPSRWAAAADAQPGAGAGGGGVRPARALAAWKAAWAQRTATDAVVRAELYHAAAHLYPDGSAALDALANARRWAEPSGTSVGAMRALGEYGWEAVWAQLPKGLRAGTDYLRHARSSMQAVQAAVADARAAAAARAPFRGGGGGGTGAPFRGGGGGGTGARAAAERNVPLSLPLVAFAYLRELNSDVRLRDWARLEAAVEANELGAVSGAAGGARARRPPLEAGALIVAAWDDPLCDVGAIAAALDTLGDALCERLGLRAADASAAADAARAPPPLAPAPRSAAAAATDGADVAATAAAAVRTGHGAASARAPPRRVLESANALLFGEEGLNNIERPYYDTRNSQLQYTLLCAEWRHGLPITLAIIYAAVCARAGLHLEPVSLPLHFVLGVPPNVTADAAPAGWGGHGDGDRLLVDAFARGQLLSLHEARQLVVSRSGLPWNPAYAAPCSARDVWARMLRNLALVPQHLLPGGGGGGDAQAGAARHASTAFGSLHAWASATTEQRRARVASDFLLSALLRADLNAHARALSRAGGGANDGGDVPPPALPPPPQLGAQAERNYAWRALPPARSTDDGPDGAPLSEGDSQCVWPSALSVTELLGLWTPWC